MTWKNIVQDHLVRHVDRLRQITQPVRDHFGVEYFTYHKIDLAGHYTVLLDRPDWAEHYVSERLFAEDPYLCHPSLYQSGLCTVQSSGSDRYLQTVMEAARRFRLDVGVIVIEKRPHCVEFFGFAANRRRSPLEIVALNQPHLLKAYARYFSAQTQTLAVQMDEARYSLPDLKGADFHRKTPVAPSVDEQRQHPFFLQLGLKTEVAHSLALTARERQCLRLLLDGHSAKTSAATLRLSPRTIESHLDHLKTKLACFTKGDLFALAKHLDRLGLL